MEFTSNEEPFPTDISDLSADDWSFQAQSTQTKSRQQSFNLFLSLSNNLLAYQNSFKKSQTNPRPQPGSSHNIKRPKFIKRKIKFSSNLQHLPQFHQQVQADKQNRIQRMNLKQRKDEQDSQSNLIKLDKMFKIMKDFNTLNETILPFKVNLNKVSHKRILANMAFRQFSTQNHQHQTTQSYESIAKSRQTKQKQENRMQKAIETEFLSIKRKNYSFDVEDKQPLGKRNLKKQPCSITNQVFTLCREQTQQGENRRNLSRRKTSSSVRRPSNLACKKTIEEIRQTYSRASNKLNSRISLTRENISEPNNFQSQDWHLRERTFDANKQCLKRKESGAKKQGEYFSDSRFFSQSNNQKTKGVSDISIASNRLKMSGPI